MILAHASILEIGSFGGLLGAAFLAGVWIGRSWATGFRPLERRPE